MQQVISRQTKYVAAPMYPLSSQSITNKSYKQKNKLLKSSNPILLRVNSESIEAMTGTTAKTVTCPFSGKIKSIDQSEDINSTEIEIIKTPGPPHPLSMEAALQVSKILTKGLHKAMVDFFEKYGPVCRFANPLNLNGKSGWLFVNNPDDIQHVCAINVKNYDKRYLPDIYVFAVNGKGILGSQGEFNKKHRSMCQPFFNSRNSLKLLSDGIIKRSQKVADVFSNSGTFETDLATQMQRLTLDIIGEVSFSHDFKETDKIIKDIGGKDTNMELDELLAAVNDFGDSLSEIFVTPMPLLKIFRKLGHPSIKKLDNSLKSMHRIMLDLVKERREEFKMGIEKNDLLTALLKSEDENGELLPEEDILEDIHDIMGAGHETTGSALAAALYMIAVHPEVYEKVMDELNTKFNNKVPKYEDMGDLRYLTQCVKETLRIYVPIPMFPREASDYDVLPSGHKVNPGDVVFMSGYSLGRTPELWPNPLEFIPERFNLEKEENMHNFQYLPFGAGHRMCLGSQFGIVSVVLAAAIILQKVKITPIKPASKYLDLSYDITMNFNKTNGLKVRIESLA